MRVLPICLFLCASSLLAQAQTDDRLFGSTYQPPRISRFYPNPATSQIQFDFRKQATGTSLRFRVFNFLGRKVIDLARVNASLRLDLSGFTRGIYIFQLVDAQGKVLESGKFQVER